MRIGLSSLVLGSILLGSSPVFAQTIRRADLPAGERLVALTFDLCQGEHERAGYQGEIVDYLRSAGVHATFFAGGKWMQSHPEQTMQLISDPLFEVGNHSWAHANLRTASSETIEREISLTQLEYVALRTELARRGRTAGVDEAALDRIPEVPRLFRFPFGTCRPEALEAVRRNGLKAIQWDVVTGDPAPRQTANGIVATVLHQVRPGSIVIFHANGRGHGTVDAIPRIVPVLRERGYQFVTVSELLERATGIETATECYELRPGDNARYDRIRAPRHRGTVEPAGRSP